jgi:hypothetical protein
MDLAGDDPEHVIVVPGGLFAPTAYAGLTAAIGGDEVEGQGSRIRNPGLSVRQDLATGDPHRR